MAYLYADFPVKKDANGDPVYDDEMEHSEPVLFPGDKLRWRLVSDEFTLKELESMHFKFEEVTQEEGSVCPAAQPYPLKQGAPVLGWSNGRIRETEIRGNSSGKRVFPIKKGGNCSCESHTYKAIFRVKWKGSGSIGAEGDPHVKFHREGQ